MVQSIRQSSTKYETQDSQSTTTIFPHSFPLSTFPFIIGRNAVAQKGPEINLASIKHPRRNSSSVQISQNEFNRIPARFPAFPNRGPRGCGGLQMTV